ncbi:MAG: hypothetical protein OXJ63_02735 [Gammaproteobacteria bacterium]|nr:hypothetical protein [Gammaproteobacteria bacterium]
MSVGFGNATNDATAEPADAFHEPIEAMAPSGRGDGRDDGECSGPLTGQPPECSRLAMTSVTSPWYSVKEPVHHNNEHCRQGGNIIVRQLRLGTGDRPLCKECAQLALKAEHRQAAQESGSAVSDL